MLKKVLIMTLILLLLLLTMSFAFGEDHYVQVGAFSSKFNADKYSNYLKSVGYSEVTVMKVHDLYKVYLGPFTYEEASEALKNFKASGGSGFIKAESQIYIKVDTETTETETTETETTETETTETETTETETTETETTETETTETETTETETTETETTETETTETETTETETTDQNKKTEEEKKEDIIKQVEKAFDEEIDYKAFTITFVIVLWLLFIMIIFVYRKN